MDRLPVITDDSPSPLIQFVFLFHYSFPILRTFRFIIVSFALPTLHLGNVGQIVIYKSVQQLSGERQQIKIPRNRNSGWFKSKFNTRTKGQGHCKAILSHSSLTFTQVRYKTIISAVREGDNRRILLSNRPERFESRHKVQSIIIRTRTVSRWPWEDTMTHNVKRSQKTLLTICKRPPRVLNHRSEKLMATKGIQRENYSDN